MTKHKIMSSMTLIHFGGRFRKELLYIKCSKTDKVFELIASYGFNKELDKFDNPTYNYSYCPHCAEKLDFKE